MERFRELESTDRVRAHTAPIVNERIEQVTDASVANVARGGPNAVQRRLAQLDREWDVDRALMANFAVVGGASYALSQRGSSGWTWFFRSQLAFLLMHAVVGWCPPASVFRRLGFRTTREIEAERAALLRLNEDAESARRP
jgi:hypothetical protein